MRLSDCQRGRGNMRTRSATTANRAFGEGAQPERSLPRARGPARQHRRLFAVHKYTVLYNTIWILLPDAESRVHLTQTSRLLPPERAQAVFRLTAHSNNTMFELLSSTLVSYRYAHEVLASVDRLSIRCRHTAARARGIIAKKYHAYLVKKDKNAAFFVAQSQLGPQRRCLLWHQDPESRQSTTASIIMIRVEGNLPSDGTALLYERRRSGKLSRSS